MTCFAPTSAHDAVDPRRLVLYVEGYPKRDAVLCRGCRERLTEMGMEWREERRAEPDRKAWSLRLRRVA